MASRRPVMSQDAAARFRGGSGGPPSPLIQFRWRIDDNGHEWRKAHPIRTGMDDYSQYFAETKTVSEMGDTDVWLDQEPEWCLYSHTSLLILGALEGSFHDRAERVASTMTESPSLFREFLELDATDRAAVKGFADKNGLLGLSHPVFLSGVGRGGATPYRPGLSQWESLTPKRRAAVDAFLAGGVKLKAASDIVDNADWFAHATNVEPLSKWEEAVTAMRLAWATWLALWDGNMEDLGRQFTRVTRDRHLNPEGSKDFRPPATGVSWYRNDESSPPVPYYFVGGNEDTADQPAILADFERQWGNTPPDNPSPSGAELRTAALVYLRDEINRGLRHGVQAFADVDGESGRVVTRLHPKTLLGALWVQFAQAVEGGVQYKKCRSCCTWFALPVGGDGRRDRKDFCRDACKTRYHRQKRERATALFESGVSVKKIAAELGVEPDSVRKWVGKPKG